jgi:hypothetical protein
MRLYRIDQNFLAYSFLLIVSYSTVRSEDWLSRRDFTKRLILPSVSKVI